ncbi:mechanosensitive ion channel domain-containing protein [Sedimenticola sp.]|uniref:mechanosensitive ion channel domain-containing protein n=1 Tax=Sedimenticola sp. TaxID=1940285 RepID=UPI002588EC61|nr:mechanosensitive ion channel domain-containing protein [Sedimenticola sp.]MCW8904026.1 mechanosensitive ion channel [Sedimenticola sp.]
MRSIIRYPLFILLLGLMAVGHGVAQVQDNADSEPPASSIAVDGNPVSDQAISKRIRAIFQEIPALHNVEVSVQSGVVRLSGTTTDQDAAQRAEALVARLDGVVTIENAIARDVSLNSQLTPAWKESRAIVNDAIALIPLLTLALLLFVAVTLIGVFLAQRRRFWKRITPNAFVAELAATSVRLIFVMVALVLALNLLGATALLSAVLGSAGVIGLAVGFAVRDTIENYIASIMLSLRQPFRPKDHVVINNNEGQVIRLTSRATILMTLDGNHLRIPNADVFKATILNYTTNPERRFNFELGVDAADDPLAAIQTGLDALRSLNVVLKEPPPRGIIQQVGDSNIVIQYAAWMNQRQADFGKSRSIALTTVKHALEAAGFGLPEPIYRLRFDTAAAGQLDGLPTTDTKPGAGKKRANSGVAARQSTAREAQDVSPERHLEDKVEEERRDANQTDLLNEAAPAE